MACNPKYSARQRIVVEAVLVGNPAPSTPRADRRRAGRAARQRPGRRRSHGPGPGHPVVARRPAHLVRGLVPLEAPAARLVARRALRRADPVLHRGALRLVREHHPAAARRLLMAPRRPGRRAPCWPPRWRSCSARCGLAACSGDATTESTTTTSEPVVESTTTTEVPLSAGKQVSFFVPAVGDCFDVRPVDKAAADPPRARLLAPPPAPGVRRLRLHRRQGLPGPGRRSRPRPS